MSWWRYAGGLSPGPAAIPNLTPVAWQRVSYERGQPIEVITWLWVPELCLVCELQRCAGGTRRT
jgi:hypothetical protein